VGGHSFGGMTAIAVSKIDTRVQACITLDPWIYVCHKEINSGDYGLNLPYFAVSTEYFHPVC
jgi:cephalosporin-C deacetylase-like acetyl esterase